MDLNKIKNKKNWQALRENREFINKYLDIMSSNPEEVNSVAPLMRDLYDSISIEDLVSWMCLVGELQKLFTNEELGVLNILVGRETWSNSNG